MYAVYILQCADNSYYTGLSNDFDKRIWQHETGFFPDCYTYKRRPIKVVWHTRVETTAEATKLEKQIKGWSRKKKEALINQDISELKRLSNYKKESSRSLRQAQGHIDYLIIGQGISGTFLSYYLQKEKKSFLVIDNNYNNSPSKIAAGIINPVTGRRLVTVWMVDDILPFAWKAYQEIGHELNITAISQKSIIDFFPNPFMRESFLQKIETGDKYVHSYPEQNHFNSFFNYELGCGEIRPVYTAHLETLLPAWRQELLKENNLLEENFEIEQLKIEPGKIRYKNITADKIIFCDGSSSFENPFFRQLPFAPNKGEALIARIPDLPGNHIYKKGMMIVPIAEKDFFWIGASYIWDFETAEPTSMFRENTEQLLKQWLKIPFEIVEHRSGLRPATLERRPFVGFHPLYTTIGILNGMGTKGCSLAPFFAKQLTDHLLYEEPISADASIDRFKKILTR
jgi:predicted GIY-YIG superfamily endonuclease/glycine/D-amino acid oxidase-like deaminating enzyme